MSLKLGVELGLVMGGVGSVGERHWKHGWLVYETLFLYYIFFKNVGMIVAMWFVSIVSLGNNTIATIENLAAGLILGAGTVF